MKKLEEMERYELKEVGKYNVEYLGLSWYEGILYQMIMFEEFNGNVPVKGSKKTLYFRVNTGTKREYIVPQIKTEADVEKWLKYPNNEKIKMYQKVKVETIVETEVRNKRRNKNIR